MEAHVFVRLYRDDVSDDRRPIEDLAKDLSLTPDRVLQKGARPNIKRDFIEYECKPQEIVDVDYVEHEVNLLLKPIEEIQFELIHLLDDYDVCCNIAFYSNGQTNPGIHLNADAINLLAGQNGTLDIDMYITEGDNGIYLDDPYFKPIHKFLFWIETKWKDWWGL